jgi:hypothetical protein
MNSAEEPTTPALRHLLIGYYHPDWQSEGDEWFILDEFVIGEVELAAELPREIEVLLAELSSETQVEQYLRDLDPFCPLPSSEDTRGWLSEVARQISTGEAGATRRAQLGPYPGRRPPRHRSTFPDQATAEQAIGTVLDSHHATLQVWQGGIDERIVLRGVSDDVVGTSFDSYRYLTTEVRGVHVVIERSSRMPDGWRIHTGYPIPHEWCIDHGMPALAHLMGGYFHQDWPEDYENQAAAVAHFIEQSPGTVDRIPGEIERLRELDQVEAYSRLVAMGCEFSANLAGEDMSAWLAHIAARCHGARN